MSGLGIALWVIVAVLLFMWGIVIGWAMGRNVEHMKWSELLDEAADVTDGTP